MLFSIYPFKYFYFVLALSLLALNGCFEQQGYSLAQVSGKILVDDNPAKDITITFSPVKSDSNPNPGPYSFGVTDSEGNFSLKTNKNQPGAVVGKHKISISSEVYDGVNLVKEEFLPARYHSESETFFDITQQGTKNADFKIESK